MITTDKSLSDHSGVGYKGESFGTKTIFVKSGLLNDSFNVFVKKIVVKSVAIENKSDVKQSVTTSKFVSNSWQKQNGKIFVPICHFCGVKGHIRPRCFTLMNFLENHYQKTKLSRYFQKPTPRPKIDLRNDSKMKWVNKSELKTPGSPLFLSYLPRIAKSFWMIPESAFCRL